MMRYVVKLGMTAPPKTVTEVQLLATAQVEMAVLPPLKFHDASTVLTSVGAAVPEAVGAAEKEGVKVAVPEKVTAAVPEGVGAADLEAVTAAV